MSNTMETSLTVVAGAALMGLLSIVGLVAAIVIGEQRRRHYDE
jgi:hypothetical protein